MLAQDASTCSSWGGLFLADGIARRDSEAGRRAVGGREAVRGARLQGWVLLDLPQTLLQGGNIWHLPGTSWPQLLKCFYWAS